MATGSDNPNADAADPRLQASGGGGGGSADNDAPPPSRFPLWLPAFVTAAAGGLLFGYDIGSVSGVVRVLSSPATAAAGAGSPFGSLTSLGALSAAQLGAVASASLAGALASSAAMFRYGDDLGRRKEMALAGAAYLTGTALQAAAPSVGVLLAGRLVYGLGIGLAMHAGPLYIAETAPARLRGLLVSAKEAAIVAGILGGYLAGAAFQPDWRTIFAVAAAVEVPFAASAALGWVPETPRWLLLRAAALEGGQAGQPDAAGTAERVAALRAAAVSAVAKLEGLAPADARPRVDAMATAVADTCLDASGRVARASISSLYADPASQAALAVGLGCVVLQQITGQPSVLYYANQLFEAAGFGFAAAVGLGAWKLLVTGVAAAYADKAGRRPLLLVGTAGMTVALVALAAGFWGVDGGGAAAAAAGGGAATLTGARQTVVLGSILLYVGAYQLGFGPVTWLLLSELFPLRVRSAAISTGVLVNFGTNFVVTAAFESGRQTLGSGGLFAVFAALCGASVAFVAAKVPETKGLSLEEIEAQLQGESGADERQALMGDDGRRER